MDTINNLINNNWFIALLCVISPVLWKVAHDIIVKSREHYLSRSLHSHNTAFSKIYSQQFDIYIELYRKIDLMNEEYKALKKFRKDDAGLTKALDLLQQTHQVTYNYYKENRIFFSNRMDNNLELFFFTLGGVVLLQENFISNRDRTEQWNKLSKVSNIDISSLAKKENPFKDQPEAIEKFSFDATLSALKNEFRAILRMK